MKEITFGTDGIRGPVGSFPIDPEGFNILGQACRIWLEEQGLPLTFAVGWDTRASGPELAQAFAEGVGAGALVVFLGIVPTPGISLYTEHTTSSLGIAITASHNPSTDNGFKVFGGNGAKLPAKSERALEQIARTLHPKEGEQAAVQCLSGSDYMVSYWKQRLEANRFKGRTVVIDTANGATSLTTLPIMRYLGFEVIALGAHPNGQNINDGCGSEHLEGVQKAVLDFHAWLGFAQDGDGDRIRVVDEQGNVLDGDCLLGLLAVDFYQRKRLKQNCLVCTEQSNSGLVDSLSQIGIRTFRCPIGDREVFYALEQVGGNLGGESSGHIIFKDEAPTGDGLRVLLRLLTLAEEKPLYQRAQAIRLCPQAEESLPIPCKIPLEQLPHLTQAKESLSSQVKRIRIRYSGTESKLRFLVEAAAQDQCINALNGLLEAARKDFKQLERSV